MKLLMSIFRCTSCCEAANAVEITLKHAFLLWLLWALVTLPSFEAEMHWHFL